MPLLWGGRRVTDGIYLSFSLQFQVIMGYLTKLIKYALELILRHFLTKYAMHKNTIMQNTGNFLKLMSKLKLNAIGRVTGAFTRNSDAKSSRFLLW